MNSTSSTNLQFSLLICEDDLDEQKLLANIITKHFPDWKYYFVSDEIELAAFLKTKTHFSILLLDINLPGKDGIEILKHIRQINSYKSLPIIGLSNETNQEKIFDVFLNGATTFFSKPVDTDELIKILKTLPAYGSHL